VTDGAKSGSDKGPQKARCRAYGCILSEPVRRAWQTHGPQHDANDAAPKSLASSGIAGRDGDSWVATRYRNEEAWYRGANTTGGRREPTGVGSTARADSTAAKVGKVSWVASALPHSEGAAYKRQSREIAACLRD
jgi:hypothetical protein